MDKQTTNAVMVEEPKQVTTESHYQDVALSEHEHTLLLNIEQQGEQLAQLIKELQKHNSFDQRAISIAKTELQGGFMWLKRAIKQTETF